MFFLLSPIESASLVTLCLPKPQAVIRFESKNSCRNISGHKKGIEGKQLYIPTSSRNSLDISSQFISKNSIRLGQSDFHPLIN